MTTELEQTTTEPEQMTTPPLKAPIDTAARKKRVAALPPASRLPLGADPLNFVSHAETMGSAGPIGSAMSTNILSTLEAAQKVMDTCADGEDKVIASENQLRQNAAHTGRLAMHNGKVTAVPGQYDELARAMGPKLDKAITEIEARIKRHNDHMVALLGEMDAAMNCPQTASDKALMAQVRDHMMSLSEPQRKGFLSKVAQEGDLVAIHTILNSPSYLMGIKDKDQAKLREDARKTLKPEHWKSFELGQKAEKAMELAKKSLVEKKGRVERYRAEDQKQAVDALSAIRAL